MAFGGEEAGKTLWLFSQDATANATFANDNNPYLWDTFRWTFSNPISNTEVGDRLPYVRRPMRVALTRLVLITSDEAVAGQAPAPTEPYLIRVCCEELRGNNYMTGSTNTALLCDIAPGFNATDGAKVVQFERQEPQYTDFNQEAIRSITLRLEQREMGRVGQEKDWQPLGHFQSFMAELRFT